MRVVGSIPHPDILITVFAMNEKYVVKMEAGPMEQTYKIPMDSVAGLDGVKKMFDDVFIQKVVHRFNDMFLDLQQARKKSEG